LSDIAKLRVVIKRYYVVINDQKINTAVIRTQKKNTRYHIMMLEYILCIYRGRRQIQWSSKFYLYWYIYIFILYLWHTLSGNIIKITLFFVGLLVSSMNKYSRDHFLENGRPFVSRSTVRFDKITLERFPKILHIIVCVAVTARTPRSCKR